MKNLKIKILRKLITAQRGPGWLIPTFIIGTGLTVALRILSKETGMTNIPVIIAFITTILLSFFAKAIDEGLYSRKEYKETQMRKRHGDDDSVPCYTIGVDGVKSVTQSEDEESLVNKPRNTEKESFLHVIRRTFFDYRDAQPHFGQCIVISKTRYQEYISGESNDFGVGSVGAYFYRWKIKIRVVDEFKNELFQATEEVSEKFFYAVPVSSILLVTYKIGTFSKKPTIIEMSQPSDE